MPLYLLSVFQEEGAEPPSPELVRRSRRQASRDQALSAALQRALCTVAEKLSAEPTRMVEQDWQPLLRGDDADRAGPRP